MFSSYLNLAGDFICFHRVGLRWQDSVDSFCALAVITSNKTNHNDFLSTCLSKQIFLNYNFFHDSFKVKDPKTCYSADKWTNSAK